MKSHKILTLLDCICKVDTLQVLKVDLLNFRMLLLNFSRLNLQILQFTNNLNSTTNATNEYGIIQAKTNDGLSVNVSLKCFFKLKSNLDDVVYIFKQYTEVLILIYSIFRIFNMHM